VATLNTISKFLYGAARATRDVQAVNRSYRTRSFAPIGKRLVRKAIGRGFGRTWGGWPR
jgi:hypothetical protein